VSRIGIALIVAALAMTAAVLPVVAQDDPEPPAVASGVIMLPEGSVLPAGAIVNVELQDTSLADAAAVRISTLSMEAGGTTAPIPFALSLVAGSLEEQGSYTLSIRIEPGEGALLYINDRVTPAIDERGPITDVVAELIVVDA